MDIYTINRKTNETKHHKCIYDFTTFFWGKSYEDYIVVASTKKGDILVPFEMIGADINRIQAFLLNLCN